MERWDFFAVQNLAPKLNTSYVNIFSLYWQSEAQSEVACEKVFKLFAKNLIKIPSSEWTYYSRCDYYYILEVLKVKLKRDILNAIFIQCFLNFFANYNGGE